MTRDEPRFLTHDQVEHLAEVASGDGDVIRLLAYTGLRFGEMAALRVRRVDFLRRRLVIAEAATEVGGKVLIGAEDSPAADGPAPGRSHGVSGPAVRGQVCRRPRVHNTGRHSPAAAQLAPCRVRPRCARAAGLVDVTPHDLRHTAASLAVASGATVKAVQRMLGHASARMTLDVYSGLFDDDLGDLADRMDAAARAAASARVGAVWAPAPIKKTRTRKRAGHMGGPPGIEPRTRGLKVRCSAD